VIEREIARAAHSTALRVPAATAALGLVRLFAASIGRHVDLPPEVVEDLKLALTEVGSAAIEASRSDDDVLTVTLSWPPDPAALEVRLTASTSFSRRDGSSDHRARLLHALRLELRETDDGHGVGFVVPTSSSS
jgi:anti-sigma regulatory factor (Ser/Thr protein kinase)